MNLVKTLKKLFKGVKKETIVKADAPVMKKRKFVRVMSEKMIGVLKEHGPHQTVQLLLRAMHDEHVRAQLLHQGATKHAVAWPMMVMLRRFGPKGQTEKAKRGKHQGTLRTEDVHILLRALRDLQDANSLGKNGPVSTFLKKWDEEHP